MIPPDDQLWPHFEPLWDELRKLDSDQMLLIAGGYGLYLKQLHCLENPGLATVVPMDRWLDNAPRVTRDMDLVVDLEFIADADLNRKVCEILRNQGFTESEVASGLRWQWVKTLEDGRSVVVELHAPSPEEGHEDLVSDGWRVKRRESLGKEGVHGHDTSAAVGSVMHPFEIESDGGSIKAPNSITWAIMKLTAMRDRWESFESESDEEKRIEYRETAEKHGQDVCRVVALTDEVERDRLKEVVAAISNTPEFQDAVVIREKYFSGDRCWATDFVANNWTEEDFETIRSVLAEWFPASGNDG